MSSSFFPRGRRPKSLPNDLSSAESGRPGPARGWLGHLVRPPLLAAAAVSLALLTGCGQKDPVSQEMKDLKSGDPLKRESAILHITRMGVPGRASLPDLIKALEDPEANVRKAAAGAIGTLGKGDAAAAEALAALAKDAEWQVQIAAIEALRSMDEKEKMTTVCIAVIEGNSPEARLQAISPLSDVGPAAAPAVKALTKALQGSSDVNVKLYSALALGNIGTKAASALSALEEAASHSDENVSKAAKDAIQKIRQ